MIKVAAVVDDEPVPEKIIAGLDAAATKGLPKSLPFRFRVAPELISTVPTPTAVLYIVEAP